MTKLLLGCGLLAGCVVIHAAGVIAAVRWVRSREVPADKLWPWARLFISIAVWVVLLHMIEISLWAVVYAVGGAMQGLQRAWYFSAVTYTTTGYGDLVLPEDWRLVGAIEAVTGILMCGWSTGFFFAVVSRMYSNR